MLAPEEQETLRSVKQPMEMRRLDQSTLDTVLISLLAQEPPALVTAIAENGLFVPMPTPVPLRGHVVIEGVSSALELVVPDDINDVIDCWQAARIVGAGHVVVHPATEPGLEMVIHFVDATHAYGVYLGLMFGLPDVVQGKTQPGNALRPRYGTMEKSDLSMILSCDKSVQRMLGWDADELVGRRSLDFVHPEDRQRVLANWMDLLNSPGAVRRVRQRHRRPDGRWMWLEVTNHNLLEDPDRRCMLAELVDISEEMAATEALRAGEELLRTLTEALPVGVVQLGPDGHIVYRNDRAESVMGCQLQAGEAFATPVVNPKLVEAVNATLGQGCDQDLELAKDQRDGAVRRMNVSLRPLGRGDGGITGAIACLSDVTDAAELREELARLVTYDSLTGCLSRRAVLEQLGTLTAAGAPVTVLFVDLDRFKEVNDRHGHAAGDALLRHVGACLQAGLTPGEIVGRLGGDEFLIATTRPDNDSDVEAIADATAKSVGQPLLFAGLHLTARASIGAARSTGVTDADILVAAADAVMYRTKTERRATSRNS
jgi:diguanylate cyclase (GGDEF)-like protein/PAS domain S-box-containing protein